MTIRTKKILFISFTLLFSVVMLSASALFLLNYEDAKEWFLNMGVHPILVFPIAMAQILGVILLWSKIQFAAVKWVYIGFATIFLFAMLSHFFVNDGFAIVPLVMGIILLASYKFRAGFAVLEPDHSNEGS